MAAFHFLLSDRSTFDPSRAGIAAKAILSGQFDSGVAMIWIELMIALFTGAIIVFFGAAAFVVGARADENDRHTAGEAQNLPAVEPLHLAHFDGDAYLGEVGKMMRDSAAERQEH